MTTPTVPPAPESPATPPKKGLPVIAWVGIGCGGLVVLVVIVLVIVGVVFGSAAKKFAEEAERNPAKATVELMAKFDKDIEIVGADDEKQTVTVRVKSTGETVTLTQQDIESGRFPGKTSPPSN